MHLTASHVENRLSYRWSCFFVFQSAASSRGSIHSSHHSGQLHCTSSSCGGSYSGGSLRPNSGHRRSSQACTRCSGGCCYCCCLWRVPASTRHYRLWLRSAPAWSSSAASTSYISELPGTLSVYKVIIMFIPQTTAHSHSFSSSSKDTYSYVRSTAPAVAYDSKQYYQQPTATAAVAAAQPQPSVAESYYQTGNHRSHTLKSWHFIWTTWEELLYDMSKQSFSH